MESAHLRPRNITFKNAPSVSPLSKRRI
ncbi:hypothetical protein CCACVL1_26022 [Corchorus capsularis]|uniref:Uncharacterized protein n=1 Tax=Corchorus capsularis TaxID=210143 RepID=A0A1R3GG91_COCAP|nr:hypothetical protein CCACVL1_26022 [Corchorus capsularis]